MNRNSPFDIFRNVTITNATTFWSEIQTSFNVQFGVVLENRTNRPQLNFFRKSTTTDGFAALSIESVAGIFCGF
jgi:hypothetical protein